MTGAEQSTHHWKWNWFPFFGEWIANGYTNASVTIASQEHIDDFYRAGYEASGDDQPSSSVSSSTAWAT